MSTPSGDPQRVGQLRNDIHDIYEMLGGINTTLDEHTRTLDEHTRTLDEHTRTLDDHTRTLDDHTVKLERILEILEAR